MNYYERQALMYAERYGIVEYEVKGAKMIYNEIFRNEPSYEVTINLDTFQELRRKM
ncbi:MAG TPA: hypothetical protein VK190_04745 [Pseudoneobacillus sp.]|nr:hypothetical protein [Pseudoneobacillus sp.]